MIKLSDSIKEGAINSKIGISLLGVHREMGGNYQYAINLIHKLHSCASLERLFIFIDNPELHEELEISDFRSRIFIIDSAKSNLFIKIIQYLIAVSGFNYKPKWVQGRYSTLDDFSCDVIFHPYWHMAAVITKTAAISSIHDLAPYEAPEIFNTFKRKLALKLLIRAIVVHAKTILVDSEHGKKLIINFCGGDAVASKIYIAPFEPPKYLIKGLESYSDERSKEVMKTYGLLEGYLFLPGRWGSYKNTERIIHSLNHLNKNRLLHTKLVLCGIKHEEIALATKFIDGCGLKNQVIVLGFVPDEDMLYLYLNALALVFPTLLGPTSIPVYEAMSLGCPVVVSNISGYPELVGDAGLLVDPYSIESIANALQLLIDDKGLRKSLSRSGKERFMKLTSEIDGSSFLNILRESLN
jgi:glycosyltransferase involved in cell wall biosynthesis